MKHPPIAIDPESNTIFYGRMLVMQAGRSFYVIWAYRLIAVFGWLDGQPIVKYRSRLTGRRANLIRMRFDAPVEPLAWLRQGTFNRRPNP